MSLLFSCPFCEKRLMKVMLSLISGAKKRELRVYLGGCMGDWRKDFKRRFPRAETYDPFGLGKKALAEFVFNDLKLIESSDYVFFVVNYPVYSGACVEAGYAYALGKPIYLVYLLKGRVDPMLIGVSSKVFTSIETAFERFSQEYKKWLEKDD